MKVLPHLPVVCEGVRIRRLHHRDAADFAHGSKDHSVQRFGHLPLDEYTPAIVRDQISGPIEKGLHEGSLAVLAIADAVSDDFLGSVVLFNPRGHRAEVGFWLAPWARGRGNATATLRAAGQVAAAAGLGVLEAKTHPENVGSRRALESAGFDQVGDPSPMTAPSGRETIALTFERSVVDFQCNV